MATGYVFYAAFCEHKIHKLFVCDQYKRRSSLPDNSVIRIRHRSYAAVWDTVHLAQSMQIRRCFLHFGAISGLGSVFCGDLHITRSRATSGMGVLRLLRDICSHPDWRYLVWFLQFFLKESAWLISDKGLRYSGTDSRCSGCLASDRRAKCEKIQSSLIGGKLIELASIEALC